MGTNLGSECVVPAAGAEPLGRQPWCNRRLARHQNGKRRVVVVVRERGGNSVPAVIKSEAHPMNFLRSHIAHGTTVNADEAGSWDDLHKRFSSRLPRSVVTVRISATGCIPIASRIEKA
jgi:ISXO2-like transposase domain